MARCAPFTAVTLLLPVALFAASAGCMSAETSEASQLTRLEHGIDTSTTVPDRFNSRGELPPPASSSTPAAPPPPPVAVPPVANREPASSAAVAGDPPEDTNPRPTLRVWGAPSGHAATPGFAPVAKIIYDEPAASATPAK